MDGTYCSVQYGTKLLLLDYNVLLYQLFYQLTLRKFGEMPRILLATPLSIKEYVLSALHSPESGWKEVEKDIEEELQLESASKSDSNNKDNGQEANQTKLLIDSREVFADRINDTIKHYNQVIAILCRTVHYSTCHPQYQQMYDF